MRHAMIRLRRTGIVVALLLCAAGVPTAAQQAPDSALAGRAGAQDTSVRPADAVRPGPRVAPPRFQSAAEPILPRSDASPESSAMPAKNHTIVVSTLTLVLVGIIVLLLITR